jgi:hypothetical protein
LPLFQGGRTAALRFGDSMVGSCSDGASKSAPRSKDRSLTPFRPSRTPAMGRPVTNSHSSILVACCHREPAPEWGRRVGHRRAPTKIPAQDRHTRCHQMPITRRANRDGMPSTWLASRRRTRSPTALTRCRRSLTYNPPFPNLPRRHTLKRTVIG